MNNQEYDAIVIGSGVGGLCTAAILAKFNKFRVLLLEQCFNPGGQTQTFSRSGKFQWDPCVQNIGEMYHNGVGRQCFDYITNNSINWVKRSGAHESYFFPDFSFTVPGSLIEYKSKLIEMFPNESKAITQYFKDIKAIRNRTFRKLLNSNFPLPISFVNDLYNTIHSKKSKLTTSEYMNEHFKDSRLKSILSSIWGTYAVAPSKSSFSIHATIVNHYLCGTHYPEGGSGEIAKAVISVIKEYGGQIQLNSHVDEILIKNSTAYGLRVTHRSGKNLTTNEFYAPKIISDAGIYETFTNLLPDNSLTKEYSFDSYPNGCSALILHVGLKKELSAIGFTETNYWIFNTTDHDTTFSSKEDIISGNANHCWLFFSPERQNPKKSKSAVVIYFIDSKVFKQWKNDSSRKSDPNYIDLKQKITDSLISLIENRLGNFKEHIEYTDLSTPLTLASFTKKHAGAMYGIPAIPKRFDDTIFGPETPIKNLYLTGNDAFCCGIVGALWGGINAACAINGRLGLLRLLFAMKFNIPKLLWDIYSK
jgi:phytoene dehydrogenase-like protein